MNGNVDINPEMMLKAIESLRSGIDKMNLACNNMSTDVIIARQCMDSENGPRVAAAAEANIEAIKRAIPSGEDTIAKLEKALKLIRELIGGYGRR